MYRNLATANLRAIGRGRRLIVLLTATVCIVALGGAWALHRSHGTSDPSKLARLRSAAPPGMVLIPAGEFLVGSDDADADDDVRPRHRENLPDYYIDVHEVTNREFQKFDPTRAFPADEADMPANSINYAQAEAYARSVGKRIPTDREWEKAARGTDGRRYPWGDRWDPKRVAPRRKRPGEKSPAPVRMKGMLCAIGPSRLQNVGSVPSGDSPYGCKDMAGNAWEWVQGFYNDNPQMRILRGGAVGYGERACRTYIRSIEGEADT